MRYLTASLAAVMALALVVIAAASQASEETTVPRTVISLNDGGSAALALPVGRR